MSIVQYLERYTIEGVGQLTISRAQDNTFIAEYHDDLHSSPHPAYKRDLPFMMSRLKDVDTARRVLEAAVLERSAHTPFPEKFIMKFLGSQAGWLEKLPNELKRGKD